MLFTCEECHSFAHITSGFGPGGLGLRSQFLIFSLLELSLRRQIGVSIDIIALCFRDKGAMLCSKIFFSLWPFHGCVGITKMFFVF